MLDQGLLFMDSDLAMLSTSQRWRGMTQTSVRPHWWGTHTEVRQQASQVSNKCEPLSTC